MAEVKIVACVPIHNEAHRYLAPFLAHLLDFVDEVRILDDASDDGTTQLLQGQTLTSMGGLNLRYLDLDRVSLKTVPEPEFFKHEGRFRNKLLDWTLGAEPTHILAIDADEFISDGQALRKFVESNPDGSAYVLQMREVWKATDRELLLRVDGGWRTRPVPILFGIPGRRSSRFFIADRAMACGREPMEIAQQAIRRQGIDTGISVLHFGWSREAERQARFDRYAKNDLGKTGGHADAHLRSIMWPDEKVQFKSFPWPTSLDREAILG